MTKHRLRFVASIVVLLVAFLAEDAPVRAAEPIKLTLCQLLSDPGRYNHAMVEVSGYIEHDFEDFSMPLKDCASQQGLGMGLWLEYGGTRKSQTKYCCADDIGADRKESLVVEGIPSRLVTDAAFDRFHNLLERPGPNAVTATVVGRFFAGERMSLNHRNSYWGGYGHMGGFSMLVIERVGDVQPTAYLQSPAEPAKNLTLPLPPIDPRTVEP